MNNPNQATSMMKVRAKGSAPLYRDCRAYASFRDLKLVAVRHCCRVCPLRRAHAHAPTRPLAHSPTRPRPRAPAGVDKLPARFVPLKLDKSMDEKWEKLVRNRHSSSLEGPHPCGPEYRDLGNTARGRTLG